MIPLAAVLFSVFSVFAVAPVAAITFSPNTAGKTRADAAEYAAGCPNAFFEGDGPRTVQARAAHLKASRAERAAFVLV
jgi:hypothetical protein